MTREFLPIYLASLLLCTGCGDEGASEPLDVRTDAQLYAVAATIFTQDSAEGTIYLVDDIKTVREVSPDNSLPLGSGTVKAIPGQRALLYMPFDEPTATRYDITDDGQILEGATVSAASTGGLFLNAEAASGSETMWLTVFPQFRLLEIDPRDMVILRELDLNAELDRGFPDPYMGIGKSAVRGDVLFMGVYHRDRTQDTALPITQIVALDMASGDYSISTDEDCPFGAPAIAGDTVIIAGTDAFGAGHVLDGTDGFSRSCMRRFSPDSNSFEAGFVKDLSMANGALAGEVVPVSADTGLVRVFNSSLGPRPDEVEAHWSYTYSDAWRWGTMSLDSTTSDITIIDDEDNNPPSFGRVDRFFVDNGPWSMNFVDASGRSTLAELTEGGPVEGLTVTGYVYSIDRIQ